MTDGILDLSRNNAPAHLDTEICIIGSGCGGATAARVLAEAGHEVVVLEEGGDYTGRALDRSEGERYDQLYMDRAGRMSHDMAVTVLQGRVLGGGGVINACDVVPMHEAVLELWRRRFGLSDLSAETVTPYQKRALEDLSANRIDTDQINQANQLLRRGTEALGWRGEVLRHNRVGCIGLGTCLIGCPADAKKNPRFVALPAALAAGARIFTRARAVRIEHASAEQKEIAVQRLDAKGYHPIGRFALRAKVVIVAANAVSSAQLLVQSGIGNEHVGRHLMLQPQLPILAEFDQSIEAFYGIPQAYAVTEYEQTCDPTYGWWGFRIEAVMGTPGIVSTMLPYVGRRGKALMQRYPHIAASLLLVPDEPSGRVTAAGGRLRIEYQQRDNHKQRLRQAVKAAARIYLAAGAKRVMVPVMPPVRIESSRDLAAVDRIDFSPATAPLISAHQQGTARFAPSAKDGATDPDGHLYGTRDLYVFDSSGFPTSASSHTMTPIITFSRMLSERLAARLG